MKWAVSQKSVEECLRPSNCTSAARWGDVEIMEWLYSQGLTCTADDILIAAGNRKKELFDWARGKGFDWDDILLEKAVQGKLGHLVKWGISAGCDWSYTMITKVLEKHSVELPILSYFIDVKKEESGCVVS